MSFSKFISEYRAGRLDEILDLELRKLVESTQKHSKAGHLTIKISISPRAGNESEVNIKFEKKMPARDTLSSIMFITKECKLVDEDPTQMRLFDKVESLVDTETGEVFTMPVKQI